MYISKLKKGIKEKLSQPWVWINTQSKDNLIWAEILVAVESDFRVNKCLFNKMFYKYIQSMKWKDLKVRWMFVLWISAWLSESNVLSDEWLTEFKKTVSRPTYEGYINTMIQEKMIARKKKWVYICNPNIALFWAWVSNTVFKMFEDKPSD